MQHNRSFFFFTYFWDLSEYQLISDVLIQKPLTGLEQHMWDFVLVQHFCFSRIKLFYIFHSKFKCVQIPVWLMSEKMLWIMIFFFFFSVQEDGQQSWEVEKENIWDHKLHQWCESMMTYMLFKSSSMQTFMDHTGYYS